MNPRLFMSETLRICTRLCQPSRQHGQVRTAACTYPTKLPSLTTAHDLLWFFGCGFDFVFQCADLRNELTDIAIRFLAGIDKHARYESGESSKQTYPDNH